MSVMVGFPMLGLGIALGAWWANSAWGRYWGWDPKEVWAFITWTVYAGYLHARATAGWKGAPLTNVSHCLADSSAPTSSAGPVAHPTFHPVKE